MHVSHQFLKTVCRNPGGFIVREHQFGVDVDF